MAVIPSRVLGRNIKKQRVSPQAQRGLEKPSCRRRPLARAKSGKAGSACPHSPSQGLGETGQEVSSQ